MGNRIFNLAGVVIIGVIIADLVANASGTKAVFDGVGGLWKTSINGVLGKTS